MKRLVLLLTLLVFVSCSKEDSTPPPPTKYTVSISLNPTDGGSVSPNGGQFNEGQTVSFTVTPSENFIFKNWSGSNTSSNNPLSLTINSNKTLTVNFEKKDTDGDGVTDDVDQCPDTPSGEEVNETGCSSSQVDTDGDGVMDDMDTCPETPEGEDVDENGCSDSQKDSDEDGVTDDMDQCPDTPSGEEVDENGCSDSQKDTDGDGVSDDLDQCPNTIEGRPVNEVGCQNPIYLDENGVTIKSYEWSEVGEVGIVNGISYLIVDKSTLKQMIENSEDVSKVCTSKITQMDDLFSTYQNPNIDNNWVKENVNISTWDVSNVTSMKKMFWLSSFNGDLSHWDVSNVTDMFRMFSQGVGGGQESSRFTGENGDISGWDVSNVTDMWGMFMGSKFNGDISSWDVSKVTTMKVMFKDNRVFNQDLSSWDVENVIDCTEFYWTQDGSDVWTLPKPNFTNCNPD